VRRPIVFAISVTVAVIALLLALPFAIWIPFADAPELAAPLLSMTFGGAAVSIVAVAVAVYAARRNSN
jgi:O-antigen/teichoic acid export membrane protein